MKRARSPFGGGSTLRRAALPLAAAVLLLAASGRPSAGGSGTIPAARPALEGNRAPYDLVFSPDGLRAYVTECAEGTVAVIDVPRRAVTARYFTGGERPTGLALTPDGARLLVANSYSGTVAVLAAADGVRQALIDVPGMPYGVAAAPDGRRAYVSVSQLDEIAVLDLDSAAVTGRVKVGRRPRALDLTPDGKTLAVANLAGASVSVVNTASLREEARVNLKGTNVRGVAATADGAEVYTTVMPAFNGKATSDPLEIWHNLVQAVTLAGDRSGVGEDQWMDFARITGSLDVFGTPDQHDIVLDRDARFAWISAAGRDVVTRITIHDRKRDAIWPISQLETVVGANPRGLALTPDGKQVWVANHLGNSLSIVDAVTPRLLATIDLGPAGRRDPTLLGQYLFNNAGLTLAHRFSCSSCHPDGGADGLTWKFVHVKDGMERRNTRDLRAGVGDTAPFRWSGFESHLQEFVESEVTGLLGGPRPTAEQSAALVAAVRSLRLPLNPYRAPDGGLTPAARRGEALFAGQATCGACHAGPKHGGTGAKAWIGTTPEGQALDVPHLAGAYDSPPYLHDGRAASLEAVFLEHNPSRRHGTFHTLSPEEQADLLRFVREL